MKEEGIFPGSFDPFHKGHEFIIKKALKDFSIIYIIISWNENKTRKYSFEEIYKNISDIYKNNSKIKILINKNELTVDISKKLNCFNLIRGYRNNQDKEYERKLLNEYKKQEPRINIKYYHSKKWKFLSSSYIKKI